MSSAEDPYVGRLMELSKDAQTPGRLADPKAAATARSAVCGSRVTVDLRMAAGVVVAYGHEVRACMLGSAAAAIVASNAPGSTPSELAAVRDGVRAMLKAGGEAPGGKWADCAALRAAAPYRARHASVLLAFEAAANAASAS